METNVQTTQTSTGLQQKDGVITVSRIFKGMYDAEGVNTCELRQTITTTYPGIQPSNELQDNLFGVSAFGKVAGRSYDENRVTWIPVPEGMTIEEAQAELAKYAKARIYKIMSNRPILTANDLRAIENPSLNVSIESKAMSQLAVYPEGHPQAGEIILKDGKPQYIRRALSLEGKADVDKRTSDPTDFYASVEIQAMLDGIEIVEEQTINVPN